VQFGVAKSTIGNMPRKILVQKGEKCKGGKLSKERLSVLFCFKLIYFYELTFSDQIRSC
jgi:hypothetical protein